MDGCWSVVQHGCYLYPVSLGIKMCVKRIYPDILFKFVSTVYRTIELVNGFTGKIIRTQILFSE